MLDALNGYSNGVTTLVTTEEVTEEGTVQRNTIATPRFSKLGLFDQLLHTVASPPVAYLLLLIGLGLLIFEFFTAGVGVAELVGAVSTLLAGYGIAELPARSWAVALIVLAILAFAVDVQVGLPRTWTGIASCSPSLAASGYSNLFRGHRCARHGCRSSLASAVSSCHSPPVCCR